MSDWKTRLKRFFWLAIGWAAGIFFAAAAVSYLLRAPLGSLVLLAMAALVLPWTRSRYPILALTGAPLAGALLGSLVLFGFAMTWHDTRATAQRAKEAEAARQARQDSLRGVLAASRDSIVGKIRAALDRQDLEGALAVVQKFATTGDSTILALRDAAQALQQRQKDAAREQELRKRAAKIPASQYVTNQNIYSELSKLDPDNKTYQQKLEHYTRLAKAEAKRKREAAARKRAERERRRSTRQVGGVRVLKVSARFTGTQIKVTNQSGEDWTNCKLEINSGIVRSGWSAGPVRIPAGETVTGGILTFTKSDGERFNPAQYQVQTLDVRCDTPEGRHFWNGAFQ